MKLKLHSGSNPFPSFASADRSCTGPINSGEYTICLYDPSNGYFPYLKASQQVFPLDAPHSSGKAGTSAFTWLSSLDGGFTSYRGAKHSRTKRRSKTTCDGNNAKLFCTNSVPFACKAHQVPTSPPDKPWNNKTSFGKSLSAPRRRCTCKRSGTSTSTSPSN